METEGFLVVFLVKLDVVDVIKYELINMFYEETS
jgi:hypothetical protein